MERKIGETFEFEGKTLRVTKQSLGDCGECFLRGRCIRENRQKTGYCEANDRTDKVDVIFEEVTDEEPTEQPAPQEVQELNLCEVLKNCPEGTEFWSPMLGNVKFICLGKTTIPVEDKNGHSWDINPDSTMTIDGIKSAEPMLFPSEEQRDWSKWKCPKPKFDPKTLKPFDRVLARIDGGDAYCWFADFVSLPALEGDTTVCVIGDRDASMVIPYNDETKHLVGTSDKAPEFYRYWE